MRVIALMSQKTVQENLFWPGIWRLRPKAGVADPSP
jgi:hypothetical protein